MLPDLVASNENNDLDSGSFESDENAFNSEDDDEVEDLGAAQRQDEQLGQQIQGVIGSFLRKQTTLNKMAKKRNQNPIDK